MRVSGRNLGGPASSVRRNPAAFAAALLAAAVTSVAGAAAGKPADPRAVFARHDPHGRMPNTRVERLGTVRVGRSGYGIYRLNFANPVSLHGQQLLGVIKNGDTFMGAYMCTDLDPKAVTFGSDRVTVRLDGVDWVVRFDEDGPTRNPYFCGEGSGWQDGV